MGMLHSMPKIFLNDSDSYLHFGQRSRIRIEKETTKWGSKGRTNNQLKSIHKDFQKHETTNQVMLKVQKHNAILGKNETKSLIKCRNVSLPKKGLK